MAHDTVSDVSSGLALLFPAVEAVAAAERRLLAAAAAQPLGGRLSLVVDGAAYAGRAATLLARAPLLLERADAMPGGGVRLLSIKAAGGLVIRPLDLTELGTILTLARRVYFLPKKTWKFGHVEMIEDGLRKGVWHAEGVFDGDRLAGYLDHRDLPDGGLEIGFSMTDPDYRRQGLQKRLLGHVALAYFDRRCDISSSEGNPTLKTLGAVGFAVTSERPGERLDGSTSLYLSRPPLAPIHLTWPGSAASGARSLAELA